MSKDSRKKIKYVYDWYTDINDNVTGYTRYEEYLKPDLKNNPEPFPEMKGSSWQTDKYGNYLYQLKNKKIIRKNRLESKQLKKGNYDEG